MKPNQILRNSQLLDEYLDEQSRRRLSIFTSEVLGFSNAPHHREWYGILEGTLTSDPNGDWDSPVVKAPEGNYNRLITLLAPRSHSKSTCFTVNYPLWRIGLNPNIRILIVSASGGISASFLREIKGHITRNTNYHRVFDNLSPENIKEAEKWSTTEIIVKRPNTRLKDPTVAVASAAGTVVSKRADLIICDDMLDENNTRTADQRMKIKNWFNEVLLPVLEPDGQLIVVGTAWNTDDLYHEMMGQEVYNVRKRYKAILSEETKEVLWKERWSWDSLMQRKEQTGSMAFNKSYQNEAMSAEDRIFNEAWLHEAKRKGANRTLMQTMDYSKWDLGGLTIAGGVDLAISKKDDSDFTAMAILGQTKDGTKIPLWLSRERLTPAETKERIIALNARYKPDIVIVESNAYQKAMTIDLADTTSVPVKAYTTGGEKYDIEIGVNSLAIDFENGKWILPYSATDPHTREMVDYLVAGMLDFPSGHTEDLLMAVWFANNGLRTLTSKASSVTQASTRSVFGR